MSSPSAETRRFPWIAVVWSVALALGILSWLSRISPCSGSATAELDPAYQQALGVALTEGLRFGREIVFTTGPLGYFISSPFDPELYAPKLWLWEVLFRGAVSVLLFTRLVRRGTWLDLCLGTITLIVMHWHEDAWLFAATFLAVDLALETFSRSEPAWAARWRALARAGAMLILAVLTLIKVTSMTAALASLAILVLHAWIGEGWRSALRLSGTFVLAQCLLWLAIGQDLRDLFAYFWSSIELASGFDGAMSQPPTTRNLVMGLVALLLALGACAWHGRAHGDATARWDFGRQRAQALIVAVILLLAFKGGFSRASDHVSTFFGTAMIAPMFLMAFERAAPLPPLWKGALLRNAVTAVLVVFAVQGSRGGVPPVRRIVHNCARRLLHSSHWLAHPHDKLLELEADRARRAKRAALPRLRSIVGERGVCSFDHAQGVIFLNEMRWKPRPVFASFSVFTQRTTEANARCLQSTAGPEFVLWRGACIDQRLPSSEDPLSIQALLKSYRLRAYENSFLLMERAPERDSGPRTVEKHGELAWNEVLEVPQGLGPLVLSGNIERSSIGRLRGTLYQTPEVHVSLEFSDGSTARNRIAPFALRAGIVVFPWLPEDQTWITYASGGRTRAITRLRFETVEESAFGPRIEYQIERAPELEPAPLEAEVARELVLGASGDLPASFDAYREPDTVTWPGHGLMLLAHAPARVVYAVGPGRVRLSADLFVPPWLSSSPRFTGLRVRVIARENGEERDVSLLTLQRGEDPEREVRAELRIEQRFAMAGELVILLTPAPDCEPGLARVAIDNVLLRAVPD